MNFVSSWATVAQNLKTKFWRVGSQWCRCHLQYRGCPPATSNCQNLTTTIQQVGLDYWRYDVVHRLCLDRLPCQIAWQFLSIFQTALFLLNLLKAINPAACSTLRLVIDCLYFVKIPNCYSVVRLGTLSYFGRVASFCDVTAAIGWWIVGMCFPHLPK